jgi:hypothetical protein
MSSAWQPSGAKTNPQILLTRPHAGSCACIMFRGFSRVLLDSTLDSTIGYRLNSRPFFTWCMMNQDVRIPAPEWQNSFLDQNRFYLDIGLHLVLLTLAVSPFVVLYVKRKSPVGWVDLGLLVAALFALPFGLLSTLASLPKYTHPFIRGYAGLCALVLMISIIMVAWRFKKLTWGSYAARVLGTLLALGLLIFLFLPAVPSAREAARRMSCSNQIRQIAFALLNTRENGPDLSRSPPDNSPEEEGGPEISWRVKLLPHLEMSKLRDEYDADQPWDSEANWQLAARRVQAYSCPSEPNLTGSKGGRFASYAMLDNSNRDENNPKRLNHDKKVSRSPHRILLIESCGANIVWTEPRDVDLDALEWSLQPTDSAARREPWRSRTIGSSYHAGGIHAVFGDGATRYLSGAIDRKVLNSMVRGEPWSNESVE